MLCDQTEIDFLIDDIEFFLEQIEDRTSSPPREKISEYAEEKRVLPPNTPFPGRWANSKTPYSIEIMDNMSPHSNVLKQAVMKGAQLGLTAAAENVIAYFMDESPAPIMLISASDDLLEEWANKRLEPLIDSCDYRHKIKAQIENRKSRRTGDKALSKEFSGGFFLMASAGSPAKLRSNSIRVLIRDEIDGAKLDLRTGEGSYLAVSEARTNAWGPRKKIFDFSTPTLYETSAIYQEWLEGDRREYKVPCPHCIRMQTLKFDNLQPIYDSDKYLVDCKIKCIHCEELISNYHKTKMLALGTWTPTVKPKIQNYRSYWISSLYSPVGMLSWREVYQHYLNSKDDLLLMRSFTNLYLGKPFKETGARPKIKNIIQNRGIYKSGEVPNAALWITAGADVQRGKEKYESLNDEDLELELKRLKKEGLNPWTRGLPRIEIEILAHSHGYRTYSIEYLVFYGSTVNAYGGAWEKLRKWLEETNLIYRRADGSKIPCQMMFIDSGDGSRTATVYSFCEPYPGIIPIKGDQWNEQRKKEKGDELRNSAFKKYVISKINESDKLVTIATNYYKQLIYTRLNINRVLAETQSPGFMEFPSDYPDHYFKMLTAEERLKDGSFHAGQRANEALDCFDEKTEVLTNKGWKFFKDLKKSYNLATVNLEKNTIEYQKPKHYIKKKYKGEMIKLKGSRIDIMVTPNHRMVVYRKEYISKERKWNFRTKPFFKLAKELDIHDQIKIAANWEKKHKENLKIPAYVSKKNIEIWPEIEIDSKTAAAFMGWFVSEGSSFIGEKNTQKGSISRRITLSQKEGHKANKIREILKKLPWKFRESKNDNIVIWNCSNAQAYNFAIEGGIGVYNKKAPEWIKNSSKKIIECFLDAAILGDGWMQKKENQRPCRTYSTTSKQLADDIQELMIKNGTGSNITTRKPNIIYKDSTINVAKDKLFTVPKLQYNICERKIKKASLDSSLGGKRHYIGKKEFYKGFVYCVTIKNSTLILRRNGKAFISGNCKVYAICAGDVLLDSWVESAREKLIANGMTRDQAKKAYTHRTHIERLKLKRAAEMEQE